MEVQAGLNSQSKLKGDTIKSAQILPTSPRDCQEYTIKSC